MNGAPAIVTLMGPDERLFATTAFETDGARVLALYRTLNPEKLRIVERLVTTARSA